MRKIFTRNNLRLIYYYIFDLEQNKSNIYSAVSSLFYSVYIKCGFLPKYTIQEAQNRIVDINKFKNRRMFKIEKILIHTRIRKKNNFFLFPKI